jgi:hypothetical protein
MDNSWLVVSKQRIKDFSEQSETGRFGSPVARSVSVAFQRRKPEAIGVKAALPGFIEPARSTRCRPATDGFTRSSSTAAGSKCTWPTRPSGSSLDGATTGRIGSRRSRTTPGTSKPEPLPRRRVRITVTSWSGPCATF